MAIESKMKGPIGKPMGSQEAKKGGVWGWIIGVLLVVVLLGAGYAWWTGEGPEQAPIGSGEYQAVFLDNGQVYFGQLDRSSDRFYRLSDVFYLQSGTATIEQTSNLALTKLGNEAHGPQDEMQINVDHILFIEDMKSDSKVIEAIYSYKSSN